MEHTPGPWKFYDRRTTAALDDLRSVEGRTLSIYADSFGQTVHHIAQGMEEANARLIAAAPELLEALRHALAQSQCKHMPLTGFNPHCEKCKSRMMYETVIAKATHE